MNTGNAQQAVQSEPDWAAAGLVAIGGAVGCVARYGSVRSIDGTAAGVAAGLPLGTLTVNLLGSLLIGIVVSAIASSRWRTLLGTGFLGGFTTYSALAVETDNLLMTDPRIAIGYALATVFAGWFLAIVGLAIGRRLR